MRARVQIVLASLAAASLGLGAGCDVRPRAPQPPAPAPAPAPVPEPITLREAATAGDYVRVEQLLLGGADANEQGTDGQTPLHLAARAGQTEVVRLLVRSGARLDAGDANGRTPLHAAAQAGRLPAVQELVEAGAPVLAQDNEGRTPLQLAALERHAGVEFYLGERGGGGAEPPAETLPEPAAEPALWLTGATFRVWTSAGGATVDAEFVQTVLDTVTLRERNGNLVRIALSQLKPEDQVLARQLAGSSPPVLTRSRAARPDAGSGGSSIGARIGRDNGWTLLEGCTLLRREGNDGDSFHVRHAGKEYIFRLYYVDAAETSRLFPDRVEEQARYFRVDEADALRLGNEAKKFTERILGSGAFTVATRWEDARGNSDLPRYYALVGTAHGDLDELLVAEGLARRYGMHVESGWGSRKDGVLQRLEQEARRERAGAWGIGRRQASARPDRESP